MSKDSFYRDTAGGRELYKRMAARTSGDRREAIEDCARLFDGHVVAPIASFIRKHSPDASDAAVLDTTYSAVQKVYGLRREALNAAAYGDVDEVVRLAAEGRVECEQVAKIAATAVSKRLTADSAEAIRFAGDALKLAANPVSDGLE